jgi:glycosyltransferase involved in cell wall biosynthesis
MILVYISGFNSFGAGEASYDKTIRNNFSANSSDSNYKFVSINDYNVISKQYFLVSLPAHFKKFIQICEINIRQTIALIALCLKCKHNHESLKVFLRYHPAIFLPAIICILLRPKRFVVRTSSVDRNLEANLRISNDSLYGKVLSGIWLFTLRNCDSVVTATNTFKSHIIEMKDSNINPDKIEVIGNTLSEINYQETNLSIVTTSSLKKLTEQSSLTLFYAGSLNKDYGLENVIEAISKIRLHTNSNISLLVAGHGPELIILKELANHYEILDNVTFLGFLPKPSLFDIMKYCDVTLALFTQESLLRTGSSAIKIREYLYADKFILASEHSDHYFIQSNNLGMLVKPDSVESLVRAILELCSLKRKNCLELNGKGLDYYKKNLSEQLIMQKYRDILMI